MVVTLAANGQEARGNEVSAFINDRRGYQSILIGTEETRIANKIGPVVIICTIRIGQTRQ